MKQNKLPLFFLVFLTILLFQKNIIIQKSVISSCELFFTKLFPSLFPMMILSDLFIYFGLPELLCHFFGSFFSKIFHTSPYGAFVFFISCFSGTPANSYVIKNLYLQKNITKEEASSLLSFAFFSNPLFLYTMLSLIFKSHPSSILKLILLPYFVNILIGIIKKTKSEEKTLIPSQPKMPFGTFLSTSIKNAMNTLLLILGSVTLFFILNALLNGFHHPLLSGILEISQGLNSLISWKSPYQIKELLAIIMISFGGLSIHLQIKGILCDTDISYWEFLKGRIKQTVLSILFLFLF